MIFSILSWPVYICIVLYLAIAAPILLGWRPVVVLSGSMEPTFHVGSIIYYKQVPFDQIQEGDPITFYIGDDGSMVTHRVVEKQAISQQFITKGDANEGNDPNPVKFQSVAGKATSFSLPYAGKFVEFGKQKPVIIIMALILILGIGLDSIGTKKKDSPETGQSSGN